jgi:simple sugar transport system ATP-binding protein
MRDITRRLLRESISVGLTNPNQNVGELSGGQKQAVAIVRAIHFKARRWMSRPTRCPSRRASR